MKRLIAAILLGVLLLSGLAGQAQDFSNKGKEFWLSYSYHVGMGGAGGNLPVMTLYLTSDVNTTYSVAVFGVTTLQTGSITAGQVIQVNVPTNYVINDEGRFLNRAIHVTAAQPIVVYSYITRSAASAATLCLPTPVLGREYVASSFNQISNEANSNSFVTIVAVEDSTTVEITPSMATKAGWPAGVTQTINLNKGQIYQILGFASSAPSGGLYTGNDLSGTRIRSVSTGTASCKRIAVFSGSGKIRIPVSGCNTSSSDNLYQQLYPVASWGLRYLTVPSKNNTFNFYRVYRSDPSTNVTVNGTAVPSAAFTNDYYTLPVGNQPNLIVADKPISVAQYFTTQGCSGNLATVPNDPDMIMLNPVEQNINRVTLVSSNLAAQSTNQYPHQHHIHVIIPNGGTAISSFRFDGAAVPAHRWTVHPRDARYSYTYLADMNGGNTISSGSHTLLSDSGFLALAYGYANAESYGYSAGANVKDLYQFASIRNDFATVNFPSTCRNTPFALSITFPYAPTQIRWFFNGLFPDVTINSPVPDSVYTVNDKTLRRYTLPGRFSVPNVGTFPIRVVAWNPTSDGCGGEQEVNYDLQVFERPTAGFSFTSNGCAGEAVQFQDTSNGRGRPLTSYSWQFGVAGATATTANPSYTYTGAGSYPVAHSVITDIGCVSDTAVRTIAISQPPTANFGIEAPYCAGKTIRFIDSSLGNGGTLAQWTWDFGDGSALQTVTAGTPRTHSYTTPGTYTVSLTVTNSGGCRSTAFTRTITVHPNPVPGFTFGNACLPAGTMAFTNTSTLPGGSATTLGSLWTFGTGGPTSTQTNPSFNFSSTGPHTVTLAITSPAGCSDTLIRTVNTVFSQPGSNFSRSPSPGGRRYCTNGAITFTSGATAPGSTVATYNWDFGDGGSSAQPNPVKSYTNPGIYVVRHWVQSQVGCVSDTTRDTVQVVALPVAAFSIGALRCATDTVRFTSTSTASDAILTQYAWTINSLNQAAATPALSFVPPAAGSFAVRLTVGTDAGCSDDTLVQVTVHPKPVPDFTLPNVCLPVGAAAFTNTSTIAGGSLSSMTFSWSFGDGNTSTQVSPTHNYGGTGPFQVRLTATSAEGCVKDTTKTLSTIFTQPTAAFTVSAQEVCLGTAITFTDASTAPGSTVTQWEWNFGDGGTSALQNPVRTFAAAGTYDVTLRITSAIGCGSSVATRRIVVNRLPTARFAVVAPTCATRDITFTDQSIAHSGSLQSWSWDLGDGSPAVSGQGPVVHRYAAAGAYPVKVTVTTDKGCTGNVVDTVRVHPLPVPGFIIPQNCLADPFSQFTDTSTVAAPDRITNWSWDFGNSFSNPPSANTSNEQNPRHRYTVVGPYQVSLTVTSNNGCRATIQQEVFISNTSPVPVFRILQPSVCSNDSVRIRDSSWVDLGNIVRLEIWWDATNPASVQTVLNPVRNAVYSHRYPEFFSPSSRDVTIRIIAYSGQTCGRDLSQTFTLKATPQLRFSPLASVCANTPAFTLTQAASFNTVEVPGTGVFSGPGINATGTFNPAAAGPGTHTIRYRFTGNNNCVNDTARTIRVFPVPTADAGPDKIILEGGVDSLTGTGSGNGIRFLWTPAQWLSSDTVPRPLVRPEGDQLYTLTVTSSEGCRKTDQVLVKMLKAPVIPNVFTPNGDGVNDRWTIQYLESYPGATIDVFNRYGQQVYKSVNYPTPWDGTMNGQPLPVGTYYYIINPRNGRRQMSGFVDIIR